MSVVVVVVAMATILKWVTEVTVLSFFKVYAADLLILKRQCLLRR